MEIYYLIIPFASWIITGLTKFFWNSITHQRLAFDLVGYGGIPSNHSAIVSSMATLIGLLEGIDHPAFGTALTIAFIVVLDAYNLRNQVGIHAKILNEIKPDQNLRERIGHSKREIIVGACLGIAIGYGFYSLIKTSVL